MSETMLDVKGLSCPLPILKAKKAIKDLATGDVLNIVATDPGSATDFEAFCSQTGNKLLDSALDGGVYSFKIEKVA